MFDSVEIKEVKLEIGQLVRLIRKKRNLTQEEIATILDMSRNTIQNLESGKNFTVDTLLKVLKEFDFLDEIHKQIIESKKAIKETKPLY